MAFPGLVPPSTLLPTGTPPEKTKAALQLPSAPSKAPPSRRLNLVLRPGDIFVCKPESGNLSQIGAATGLFGHVMLAIALPRCIERDSPEGKALEDVWPADADELWAVSFMESTRSESGLHEGKLLVRVDPDNGKLSVVGEIVKDWPVLELRLQDSPCCTEICQSPPDLRAQLSARLIEEVLADMRVEQQSDWSWDTAVRAALKSAKINRREDEKSALQKVEASWQQEPICTSVAITFWQRYLCKLAEQKTQTGKSTSAMALIKRWMPVKADRALPKDLMQALRQAGWICVKNIPETPPVSRSHSQPNLFGDPTLDEVFQEAVESISLSKLQESKSFQLTNFKLPPPPFQIPQLPATSLRLPVPPSQMRRRASTPGPSTVPIDAMPSQSRRPSDATACHQLKQPLDATPRQLPIRSVTPRRPSMVGDATPRQPQLSFGMMLPRCRQDMTPRQSLRHGDATPRQAQCPSDSTPRQLPVSPQPAQWHPKPGQTPRSLDSKQCQLHSPGLFHMQELTTRHVPAFALGGA